MTPEWSSEIDGVIATDLARFEDPRGSFAEIFRARSFPHRFVQGNHSISRAGVLRGLHYHRRQADLWYVVAGELQVALADLRGGEAGLKVETVVLTPEEPQTIYIPAGVAHGFAALTDVDLIYLVTQEFDGSDEYGIAWDDPLLSVPWKVESPILSDRDRANPPLSWDEICGF